MSRESLLLSALTAIAHSSTNDADALRAAAKEALGELNPALASSSPTLLPGGKIIAYTDGSSLGNPGPAGAGVLLIDGAGNVLRELSQPLGVRTNQYAEMEAARLAMANTPEGAQVHIYSDSTYVRDGLTAWRAGWERKGFRTSSGGPVLNLELWKQLYALWDARKVTIEWVKGHSDNKYNNRVDELAKKAARQVARL